MTVSGCEQVFHNVDMQNAMHSYRNNYLMSQLKREIALSELSNEFLGAFSKELIQW